MTASNNRLLGLICLILTATPVAISQPLSDKNHTLHTIPIEEAQLRAHLTFLSSDNLKGRDTGTAEYEIAANYVASHFEQFGMRPAGDNSSWFQSVPFIRSKLNPGSVQFTIHEENEQSHLTYQDDFFMLPSAISQQDNVRGELVFVGYGIVSKELHLDDYAGLNVQDKIVVILGGRPAALANDFGAHVSSIGEKVRLAVRQGAKGVIFVDTPAEQKTNTYQRYRLFASKPLLRWKSQSGIVSEDYPELKGLAYITVDAGRKLFKSAGHILDDTFETMARGHIPAGFDLGIEVSLKRKSSHEKVTSSNVVGLVEGSDPTLMNEYIVFTSHLDHLGVDADGAVYNGALDNAAGIAIMLETARRFSNLAKPKRSILFVAVTAEEAGLLGSDYFARFPTVPLQSMVANLNIDMPLIMYPFADIVAFGGQHSTISDSLEAALEPLGLKLSPDPMPELSLFTRSDHYSFVKMGLPSVHLSPGFASRDPSINGHDLFGMFLKRHYHQPTDEASLPIDYSAGANFVKVAFSIGTILGNSPSRPRWRTDSNFGRLFSK
ncbi:aminopeptidase [Kordiimonas sediminis]|uniref:Aminopeptidase n=1 Tax=Kordiimonas sediminis TaxID=1735581 RepID=A0A919ARS6_9PROT|nr:M28 family metallopeptidase [Kordiimonas sediminis]GHF22159.1 aminopeptidase [Kordiimonas sediminis]